MTDWPVFICYRQIDGAEVSKWLYGLLNGRKVTMPATEATEEATLDVYFDAATPAVSDWQQIHRPALERARAFLVVCTPGLFAKLSANDWVHMEIDWWLKHRDAAPILIDITGEDKRWIPKTVSSRWPNAQRVLVEWSVLHALPELERKATEELVCERILGGVRASEYEVRYEDLERQKRLVRTLKIALAITLVAFTIAVVSTNQYFHATRIAESMSRELSKAAGIAQRREQDARHMLAAKFLADAERAWEKHDKLSAKVLSARAITTYDSSDIKNRALSIFYLAEGNIQRARQHLKLAMDSMFEQAVNMSLSQHRIEQMAKMKMFGAVLEKWLLLTADDTDAYTQVLRFKGLYAKVRAKRRDMLRQHSAETRALQEQLARAETRIAGLIYGIPNDTERYQEWKSDYLSVSTELADLYAQIGDSVQEALTLWQEPDWREIQKRLKADEVIVDFLLNGEHYTVFVLRHVGAPVRIKLGDADQMERISQFVTSGILNYWTGPTARHLKELNFRDVAMVEPDKEKPFVHNEKWSSLFWRSVWEPIEQTIGHGVKKIYIVPDGVFATLPFAAISVHDHDAMLLDKYLLVHLSTAHDVLEKAQAPRTSDDFLLVGDVSYGVKNKTPGLKRPRIFPSLPGTALEVMMISKMVGGSSVVLVGEDANETAFRNFAPGHRVLHLSTHGWATPDLVPLTGAEGLRLGIDAYFISLDPFLLAGVALAGANQLTKNASNDGILTAMEIAGLNLGHTELAVLAGCDTVGTARAGESTLTLVRSLHEAGVRDVIATLYTIDDQTTAHFMETFYRRYIIDMLDPAEALRMAQLEAKNAGHDPRYWAPFVAYGPSS